MKNEAKYEQLIIKYSENIVYVADPVSFELLYINEKGKKVINLEGNEYQGKKCYKLLQGRSEPCEFCTNSKLKEETFYNWTHFNELYQRHFIMNDTLIEVEPGKLARLEIAVDITENEKHARELEQLLTMEETLLKCTETLSANNDQLKAINELLNIVAVYYGGNRAYIFEINYDENTISNTYEWCAEGINEEMSKLQNLPISTIDNWLAQFNKYGEFYLTSINDTLDKESDEYRILAAQGIESLIAAPLIENNQIVGFIGVDDPNANVDNLYLLKSVTYYIINDIQKRKMVGKLEYLSYVDLLTDVYNRNRYIHDLDSLKIYAPASMGVIYLDINGLKLINDNYGHQYGDYIIKKAANLICGVFDAVYRIGGDEFVVLCIDITEQQFKNKVELLRQRLANEGDINASIGSTWEKGKVNLDLLINHADDLMYAEKQCYYSQGLDHAYSRRSSAAEQIITEIKNKQFIIFLQPKICLKTGELEGAEALIRKQREDGSLMSPDQFVPNYESAGIIRFIDFFTLEAVCKTLRKWAKRGTKSVKISVNLSRVTLLEPNVVESIARILKIYEVDPKQICIEITESVSKLKPRELHEIAEKFSAYGFSISLDDYGSQYSNMSILSDVAFNELKLDKSFIDRIVDSERARMLVSHTIDLCKGFKNTLTVAEGIENEEQLKILKEYGCDTGQGFYFSRPLSISEFETIYLNS